MAANGNNLRIDNRACYNCGQAGHISRYCPLPDRRTNIIPSTSTAIVPAQPLLTLPSSNFAIGTVASAATYEGQYNGQYSDKGWLRNRMANLEDVVGKIKEKHDADVAKELAVKKEEERKKKEKAEEDRRLREKQEREDWQLKMREDLNSRWEAVCDKIDKKDKENNEVTKLREEVARLSKMNGQGEPSTSVTKPVMESELVERLRREQEELRTATDRRFALLEEKLAALGKAKDEAKANAKLWKAEAFRPGNKRGSIAIGATPGSHARARRCVTPAVVPTDPRVNPQLQGIIERHAMEVNVLKELRLRDANDKIEA
ncbi:hypothetical protein CBR_g19930 [Chara braunii]|uniref:CCHC-type domain-containing protein n=1 Tax=Chara braunii TaxID=69332 RepID=A0A388KZ49_CHABU|nr:hypothetical protein CBR_g19930 [Chara braunii]|eukprot:GBG75298.1 hypothetical protein CBR_g19930 [Chara braunii]